MGLVDRVPVINVELVGLVDHVLVIRFGHVELGHLVEHVRVRLVHMNLVRDNTP